jgi:hypothetical protein
MLQMILLTRLTLIFTSQAQRMKSPAASGQEQPFA